MDIRKIRKLIEIAKETGVNVEVQDENGQLVKITLQSQIVSPVMQAMQPVMSHVLHPTHGAGAPVHPGLHPTFAETTTAGEQGASINEPGQMIKSPMVGTFYVSANPGARPFVEIGQRVKKGDTLCIIEAMKMFNQIEAEQSGTIKARLVENGQPVEFEQGLFIIEPSAE